MDNTQREFSPIKYMVLSVILIVLIKYMIIDISVVYGKSMIPTIKPGNIIIYNRLAYGIRLPIINRYITLWKTPKKGDIIILKKPNDDILTVKRCERVYSKNKEIFVTGDNKNNSIDSRDFGLISINLVEGKVIFYK